MGFLAFLEVLLEIGLLVLTIKYLVKFWKLCDDVSVIRKLREGEMRSSVNSRASSSIVKSDSDSGSSQKSVAVVNQATPDSTEYYVHIMENRMVFMCFIHTVIKIFQVRIISLKTV